MNTASGKILLTEWSLNLCGIKLPFVNSALQKQIQFECRSVVSILLSNRN